MRKIKLIILFFFVVSVHASAQKRLEKIETMLFSADSVVIVSHEATAGIGLMDEKGNLVPLPKLIVNKKLNQAIIREYRSLMDTAIHRLSSIIKRPFQDSIFEEGMCYIPHHSIIIFRKRKISWMEICFGCRRIETSKDIELLGWDIDNKKWEELRAFFRQQAMSFELTFAENSEVE